jgi:hypothetical protein
VFASHHLNVHLVKVKCMMVRDLERAAVISLYIFLHALRKEEHWTVIAGVV